MAIPTSELQKINPSAIIELFELQLILSIHGSDQLYRWHSGSNQNGNGEIVWQGNTYARFPVEAEGFEFTGKGQIPRPTLTVSNVLSTLTTLIQSVNTFTPANDLNGAKLTRIRTTADNLDVVNFAPVTTTTTTTTTIADPADAENITFTVTVANVSGTNFFLINGVQNPVLTMKRGSTYIFDQSDTTNVGHPLRIKSDAGGQQTTVNDGTLGTNATVTYKPAYPSAPNDLRYYCTVHGNGMGNTITMNDPNTTTGTTTTSTTSQTNPFGTPSSNKFPDEIFFLDRKIIENRQIVQYELVSALDLANVRVPKRQITRKDFDGVGTFIDA
jgi:lambda family phage minor tail protein L